MTQDRLPAPIVAALAGEPNVGKTTVFNMVTGLSQHVGNWPGKTVERRVGTCRHAGTTIQVVDLPGTYSLTAATTEERIARDSILRDRPDVVVVIADAAALERSLYLVAELLLLPVPVAVALNMVDVAEQQGIRLEPRVLETALGLPVIPMVAARNQGIRELVEAALRSARNGAAPHPRRPEVRPDHRPVLAAVRELIRGLVPPPYPEDWVAIKLLEGDEKLLSLMQGSLPPARWAELQALLARHEDAILAVAGGRYEWVERMTRAAMVRPRVGQITVTERLDRVAMHPLWGWLLLLGILGVMFWLTYAVGTRQEWLDVRLVGGGAAWLRSGYSEPP
jgi:ferrous iron transport protein B